MECCGRPNRSDVHLSTEEEAQIEAKTRQYFDGVVPKRHTKPQRSDYSSQYVDDLAGDVKDAIPEMLQFQRLENLPHSQNLAGNGNQETEEFVETEYYKDLNSVDKQHHTTGTGFIKMGENGKFFHIEPDSDTTHHPSGKCNPATNDWVPAASNEVGFNSDKPSRSDI
ncbi:uncharacterized protein LOC114744057 [Neltuma alba]|uniref:uncharacterized protein LOC114728669 n=1 Tax=Neltuma alba TaxID=207710 RepID=UPI0010A3E527|nr:uncharacterized protein LOC114728669 [Prosopis alba]XP_028788078.1 uncharacterized protein LOC114744057 [Prosopis alba]